MFNNIIEFIQKIYQTQDFIPLHEPRFIGKEKKYIEECLDSTYVSSIGPFVDKFEQEIVEYTKAKYAIAIVNGTSALHLALKVLGVKNNDEVITPALNFIASANAISYCNAIPHFVVTSILLNLDAF